MLPHWTQKSEDFSVEDFIYTSNTAIFSEMKRRQMGQCLHLSAQALHAQAHTHMHEHACCLPPLRHRTGEESNGAPHL